MRKRSELFFSVILVPVDFFALLAAFIAAYLIRVRLEVRPVAHPIAGHEFLSIVLILLPAWM